MSNRAVPIVQRLARGVLIALVLLGAAGAAHAHGPAPETPGPGLIEPDLADYEAGAGALATLADPAPPPASVIDEPFAWQEAEPHPIERFESGGLTAFGKLWVMGGFGRWTTQASPRADVYDPATDTWTRIADIPETVHHSATVVDGTDIWLIGGFIGNNPGPATSSVWVYDTVGDSW